jgi:hypothetical protein
MPYIQNVTRGADPELFLRTQDNRPITSIGLIGGSKKKPRLIGNGFALQEDNVAVEFNIPPCRDKNSFVSSLNFTLEYLRQELAPKHLSLEIVPTMEFSKEQLAHPQAQELGCEPDYNAWTGAMNPRPIAPETLRSAGGHLHLGFDEGTDEVRQVRVIKVHDLFCGTASLIHDHDSKRRAIYGKAGACRFKPYGVEYRTLSNFWIKSTELMEWIYSQSEKAIEYLNSGQVIDEEDFQKIQDCINNSDMKLFAQLNEKYAIL